MSPTISDVFTMTAMLDLLSSCKLVTHFSGGLTTKVRKIIMNMIARQAICFKFTDCLSPK